MNILLNKIVGAYPCVHPDIDTHNKWQMKFKKWKEKGQTHGSAPTVTIGMMVQWFKTMSTNEYIRHVKDNNWEEFNKRLWQRNYYEHIIRDENDFNRVQEYIISNPLKWELDEYYV